MDIAMWLNRLLHDLYPYSRMYPEILERDMSSGIQGVNFASRDHDCLFLCVVEQKRKSFFNSLFTFLHNRYHDS